MVSFLCVVEKGSTDESEKFGKIVEREGKSQVRICAGGQVRKAKGPFLSKSKEYERGLVIRHFRKLVGLNSVEMRYDAWTNAGKRATNNDRAKRRLLCTGFVYLS